MYIPPSKEIRSILKILHPPVEFTMDIVQYHSGIILRVYKPEFDKLDHAGRLSVFNYLNKAQRLLTEEYKSIGKTINVGIQGVDRWPDAIN